MAVLKDIKISELVVDEFNVRADEFDPNDDDGERLVDSIKAQGVLEPLLVRLVKGQTSKYKSGKVYSIVCGNRRYHASLEARQKTIPCVIRNDLKDITALGTSIQENLKRKSMDKIQTANGIGRMMELMNGKRTYEQKMGEMTKMFGMRENAINNYYNVYKLSKEITIARDSKVDTDTLSGIQRTKWEPEQKEKAIEVLSKIEKRDDRRVALSEMKKKTKEDESLEVEEAYNLYEKEVGESVGESYDIYLNAKERKATRDIAKKMKVEINTLIKSNHIKWLKNEGLL